MSNLWTYLQYPFAQHALIAATLIAITSGLIAPFVAMRDMAFAVHGTAELAFPTAVAGLLIAGDAVGGALTGSVVVAVAIWWLGRQRSERNTAIGVLLAFGLGLGAFLLSFYHGFASAATNILFGSIVSVSTKDVALLGVIAVIVVAVMVFIYRPLLFASVDPDVAAARGVPVGPLGLVFLLVLAVTVTEAAQIVGTLLVLSLTITPAAAARRWSANPLVVSALAIVFALIAADRGFLLSLVFIDADVKASVMISFLSFAIYLISLAAARWRDPRAAAAKPVAVT
ncbi:metal ABC transporter permease [Flexivirga sp. ID2601S]|uniref:Metal ABC transporter permease n=1 Tax=Flexivirga aerilata TaxID=1656889 RepID=A0A849ANP1_9MICO|nr:metal ABC transporter permease [Flexivirga aerilata]NNG40928.1 metal ABC transporter permease [Flexivirga aerilata]